MHCLTLDIGTYSTRVAIIDSTLIVLWSKSFHYSVTHNGDGKVEQNANAILLGCIEAITEAMAQPFFITLAAISIQRSSVVMWDKQSGQALHPMLSWMDTRAKDVTHLLKPRQARIESLSGLVLSAHYGASKMAWLNKYAVEQAQSNFFIGPFVSFICFNLLTNRPFICDESNAGRTQLLDSLNRYWSEELSDLFDYDIAMLPSLVPTCSHFGSLRQSNIPLMAVVGDQNAAFYTTYRHAFFNESTHAVINFGTGAFILLKAATPVKLPGILTTLMWSNKNQAQYCLEATINGAGSAFEWLIDTHYEVFKHKISMKNKTDFRHYFFDNLNNWIQKILNEPHTLTSRPLFINTIGGLASPFWRTDIEAKFLTKSGLLNSDLLGIEEKAIAIAESIAYLVKINIDALKKVSPIKTVVISGGLTKSEAFNQLISNVIGLGVACSNQKEASLIGAAALAFDNQKVHIKDNINTIKTVKPCKNTIFDNRYNQFIHHIEMHNSENKPS